MNLKYTILTICFLLNGFILKSQSITNTHISPGITFPGLSAKLGQVAWIDTSGIYYSHHELDTSFNISTFVHNDLLKLDTKELKNINSIGKEGFVISFEDGFRYKLKFENYLKLHYLLTGLSTKEIQRMLMNNQDISLILEETPDEFDNWVLNITKILNQWYSEKLNEIYSDLNIVNKFFKNDINLSKKELADFIKRNSFILNKGFILSTFNKENWENLPRTQKYIWAYVDEKRKEAQLKNDGLLPISFFKEPVGIAFVENSKILNEIIQKQTFK